MKAILLNLPVAKEVLSLLPEDSPVAVKLRNAIDESTSEDLSHEQVQILRDLLSGCKLDRIGYAQKWDLWAPGRTLLIRTVRNRLVQTLIAKGYISIAEAGIVSHASLAEEIKDGN